jgi:hypothetical protein
LGSSLETHENVQKGWAVLKGIGEDFQQRQAARMRLPGWLRLLMPLMVMASVFALTIASIELLWQLHRYFHPMAAFKSVSGAAQALMIIPAFFGSIVPALILLNLVLARIPALRQIFDTNAEGVAGASYQESMHNLRKGALIVVPPALILALVGAVEPWTP